MIKKMKRSNKLFCFFYVSILFLILTPSCKQKQTIVYSTSPIKEKANLELFSDIISNQLDFNTFFSRINLSVSTGTRSLSSKGTMKVINNDAVQISLQPLFGMEMFRIYFDQDEIVLIDRMNKRYVKETYEQLKEKYPIGFDFDMLLSLFTNQMFVAGNTSVQPTDYRFFGYIDNANSYYLKSSDELSGIEYAFSINSDDKIMFTHLMGNDGKYSLNWEYNNFTPLGNTMFPTLMNIGGGSAVKRMDLEIKFSDIVLNEPTSLNVDVPEGYIQISVTEIIKIIRNI